MPDSRIEDFHVRKFLAAANLTPDAPLVSSESPDCLLRFGGRVVGIEHREFYYPPKAGEKPQQELDALQALAIEQARRIFRDGGGPALYVHATFNDWSTPRTKAEAFDLAQRLADVVVKNGWASSLESREFQPWRELPEIYGYSVMPSIDGDDELWHGGAGGWVAPVECEHIQAVLDHKRDRYARYAQKAPEVWLLLVNDMWRGGVPCEISVAATQHQYASPFDRVYWFEVIGDKAIRLRAQP